MAFVDNINISLPLLVCRGFELLVCTFFFYTRVFECAFVCIVGRAFSVWVGGCVLVALLCAITLCLVLSFARYLLWVVEVLDCQVFVYFESYMVIAL